MRSGAESQRTISFWAALLTVSLGALVFLFREFLFSDLMLDSGDVISVGIFFRAFLSQSLLERGSVPGWNPYFCCGVPFIDAIHGGALYPLTLLELTGNVFRGFGYSFCFHILLAVMFAALSARQLGLGRLASAVVGLSYGLSPCLVSWVRPGHDGKLYAATWLPLIVFFVHRLYKQYRLIDLAGLATVIAVIILTPHLQMAYYALWFLLILCLWRVVSIWRDTGGGQGAAKKYALMVTAAVLVGLLVSSTQLLPSAKFIVQESPRAYTNRGAGFASQFALHTEELVSIGVPEFCGITERYGARQYWGQNPFKNNSESAGAIVVFLAALGLVFSNRRDRFLWAGIALTTIVYACGNSTPVFRWLLAVVPFLDAMEAPSTAMFIGLYSLAMLAGTACDRFSNNSDTIRQQMNWIRATVIAVPAALAGVTVILWARGPEALILYARIFRPEMIPTNDIVPGLFTRALEYLPEITLGFAIAATETLLVAIALWIAVSKKRWRGVLWVIPLLIAGENTRFNQRFVRTVDPLVQFAASPMIQAIKSETYPWRCIDNRVGEGVCQLAYHGIGSTTGILERIPIDYFDLVGGNSRSNAFTPRFANLTGTKYIVWPNDSASPPPQLGPVPLDTVCVDGDHMLLSNPNALNRAFFADSVLVLSNSLEVRDSVISGDIDLGHIALFDVQTGEIRGCASSSPAEANIVSYSPDCVTIKTRSAAERMLILTDTYFPSWTATIDDTPVKIYCADGSFRAVTVPAGIHVVTFAYPSLLSTAGTFGSFTGVVLLVTLILIDWRQRRKQAANLHGPICKHRYPTQ